MWHASGAASLASPASALVLQAVSLSGLHGVDAHKLERVLGVNTPVSP
jgi:hypothetical protein